jgi:hypothetical protein
MRRDLLEEEEEEYSAFTRLVDEDDEYLSISILLYDNLAARHGAPFHVQSLASSI